MNGLRVALLRSLDEQGHHPCRYGGEALRDATYFPSRSRRPEVQHCREDYNRTCKTQNKHIADPLASNARPSVGSCYLGLFLGAVFAHVSATALPMKSSPASLDAGLDRVGRPSERASHRL